jgi:hypothetical protein
VKDGSTETTCDVANGQFIFHHSVDDLTPIFSLPYETLLAHRTCDETGIEISPKQLLHINYFHEAIHQEVFWARRVYPSWDGRRIVVWRTRTTTPDEVRLIASIHDISGSGPLEVPVTPAQACPPEDVLIDLPLDIQNDYGGYRVQHGGFSGKAIAWLTPDSVLTLLEVPPLEGRGMNREGQQIRSWAIPSSVGLEHHGEVMDMWLDDAQGRVIIAMQDDTLVIFEFA